MLNAEMDEEQLKFSPTAGRDGYTEIQPLGTVLHHFL